jgi:cytochrome c553
MQRINNWCRGRLIVALLSAASMGVHAAPTNSAGRLYTACVACHGPMAWGSADGAIPSLAGQQKRYLEKQLEMYRIGARVDPAMQAIAEHAPIGDRHDIAVLANYLATLQPNPRPSVGSGEHLRVGQEIYAHICAACHGADGLGASGNRVPRIAGQHYPYLRHQIDVAAELHRDLAPPEMTGALRALPPAELDALADYISRLNNSEILLDPHGFDKNGR